MPEEILHKKGPVGCLLIHGFTGSPNEFVDLGAFLGDHDITVLTPTLPGHGTHSGDMFNFGWRDWFDHVKTAYHHLASSSREVFVCGLSMGGTLALHLAAHKPVEGLIALAAPVVFPGWRKPAVKYIKHLRKYRRKKHGEDVRDVAAKAKLGSYRRYPYAAVEQLFQLTDHVLADLPEIEQPLLVIHSRQDHTVAFQNADLIFNSVISAEKRKVDLERSYHVITVDVEKEQVRQEILDFIRQHSSALTSGRGSQKSKRQSSKRARRTSTAASKPSHRA